MYASVDHRWPCHGCPDDADLASFLQGGPRLSPWQVAQFVQRAGIFVIGRELALDVIEADKPKGRLRECAVKCLEGSVRVGDLLCVHEGGHVVGPPEVVELRYFQQLVRELEGNFGGLVLFAGDAAGDLQSGQTLTLCAAG